MDIDLKYIIVTYLLVMVVAGCTRTPNWERLVIRENSFESCMQTCWDVNADRFWELKDPSCDEYFNACEEVFNTDGATKYCFEKCANCGGEK